MASLLEMTRSAVAPVTRTGLFRRTAPTILPPLERATAWLSRGHVQLSGLLVPSLVLHSIGAKTGLPRDVPLMYCPDGEICIVAGSNFARERHPAWTSNLIAHPDAAVSIKGRRMPVRAELIGDGERDDVWARIERQWPGYRAYERGSGRTVRLFRLHPLSADVDVHDSSVSGPDA